MDAFFTLLCFLMFVWLIWTLISPKTALFFLSNREKRKRWPWWLVILIVFFICTIIVASNQEPSASSNNKESETTEQSDSIADDSETASDEVIVSEETIPDGAVVIELPANSKPIGTWEHTSVQFPDSKPYYITIYECDGKFFEKMDRFTTELRVDGDKYIKVDDPHNEYYIVKGKKLKIGGENGIIDKDGKEFKLKFVKKPYYKYQ